MEAMVQLLKDENVEPTARNNYAIRSASFDGHSNVVQLLLEDGRVAYIYNTPGVLSLISREGKSCREKERNRVFFLVLSLLSLLVLEEGAKKG